MVSVASIGCAPADAPATPDSDPPAVTEGEGDGSANKTADGAADATTEMKDKAADAKEGSGTQ